MDLSSENRAEIAERLLNMKKAYDTQSEYLKEAHQILNLCRYNFSQKQLAFKNGYDVCTSYLNNFRPEALPTYEELES